MRTANLRIVVLIWLLLPISVQAGLTHRYSFNDGTANDSVGHANGILENGSTVSAGQLRFDPSVNNGSNYAATGQYVSLPTNLVPTRDFTIEAWATEDSSVPWQRIFDMGNSVNGDGEGFVILTPYNNPGLPLGQISLHDWGGAGDTNYVTGRPASGPIVVGEEYQYAYVHNLDSGLELLYINGALIATSTATVDPSNTAYTNFYIGRSQFSADPYFDGSIDELRTYNTALTGAQISTDYALGPDLLTVPEPASVSLVMLPILLLRNRRSTSIGNQRAILRCS